jgi:hypothetical protein
MVDRQGVVALELRVAFRVAGVDRVRRRAAAALGSRLLDRGIFAILLGWELFSIRVGTCAACVFRLPGRPRAFVYMRQAVVANQPSDRRCGDWAGMIGGRAVGRRRQANGIGWSFQMGPTVSGFGRLARSLFRATQLWVGRLVGRGV